jgi:hypothetical protein
VKVGVDFTTTQSSSSARVCDAGKVSSIRPTTKPPPWICSTAGRSTPSRRAPITATPTSGWPCAPGTRRSSTAGAGDGSAAGGRRFRPHSKDRLVIERIGQRAGKDQLRAFAKFRIDHGQSVRSALAIAGLAPARPTPAAHIAGAAVAPSAAMPNVRRVKPTCNPLGHSLLQAGAHSA